MLSGATCFFARHELQQTIATNQTATVIGLAGQMDENLIGTRACLQFLATHLQQHTKTNRQIQAMLLHHDELRLFFDAGILLLSPEGKACKKAVFCKS